MDRFDVGEAYIFYYTSYTGNMFHIPFNKMHFPGPSRCKFKANTACSREKVKYAYLLKVNPVVDYIEKTLSGKVSCWPCLKTRGRSDPSSLVCTSDYSQLVTLKRFMYLCNSISLKT